MTDAELIIDLGATLRALRRAADLSQRELAARSGVPQTTVARIEAGRSVGPSFRTVERLVAGAGGRLTIASSSDAGQPPLVVGTRTSEVCIGTSSAELRSVPQEALRDAAGRHCPAHLDARAVREPKDWPGAWWAHWPGQSAGYSSPLPAVTYRLDRDQRDRDRRRERVRRDCRVRRYLDPALPTTCWRFVAELPDGELVGELRAHERSDELLLGYPLPDRHHLVLDGVLVAPAYRRLGIGRRLLTVLTAEMARCGVPSAHAVTEDDGARLLHRCGFTIESRRAAVMRFDQAVSGERRRRW
ncbi:GNAT family N-acetyltransferase [Micromonospora sp. NBS 11-29]|uniref:GNAT family N-acetyltransferase n=1 Tax=Micromonospora sp. NBS 11-29 TaxID=1960879 RepID=UPI000B794FF2|nr:GNAT family N-acetyltransferase [Micromonospora sp. NBS 11-29]